VVGAGEKEKVGAKENVETESVVIEVVAYSLSPTIFVA
jgi:hypothetical protein